ncbi:hypothetical protein Scep_025947 [Stephania cephalantha]|uniref:Uncharacterized protein n=1 Tax=Stephania cephalantha TaxID=152367 RepID=A0AAP0ERG1_9MAGN
MFRSRFSKKISLVYSSHSFESFPPKIRSSFYGDLNSPIRVFPLIRNLNSWPLGYQQRFRSSLWSSLVLRQSYCVASSSVARASSTEKKSQRMLWYLIGLTFAMVGASYAAVPLYRRFCQATGYGGTVQRRETVEEKIARHAEDGTTTSRSCEVKLFNKGLLLLDPLLGSTLNKDLHLVCDYREIVVQFNADVADGLQWKFIPTQREVRVKPGESALAFYTAENCSSTPITGVSTYNVTPMKAGVYFNKIQCFCFEEQRLLPGEQIDMPVFFYIDPEFETDPKLEGVNNLILSYTFFKVAEG